MLPSAIVLAGGKSSRFGSDKAAADIEGQSLIALCVSQLLGVFDKVLVVAKDPAKLRLQPRERVLIVVDNVPQSAALVGMISGLRASNRRLNYIVGCDMPAVVPELIHVLYSFAHGRDCALRCDKSGRPQPLAGFYSKAALPLMEEYAAKAEFRLMTVIEAMDAARLEYDAVARVDPELRSFWNINTPQDFEQLKETLGNRLDYPRVSS